MRLRASPSAASSRITSTRLCLGNILAPRSGDFSVDDDTVAWKRFKSMYRSAETSASSNSVGSAGRSRAAFRASSHSHSATVFPAPSAAASTSASSSGVTLVAIVLARRTGRPSPFGESGDGKGFGMRGVFMGEPASQPACTRRNYTSSAGMLEAFAYQCVYAPRSSERSARLRA